MRKGFTLIEVLAVIVILGIIALITTPIILNVISSNKERAFIESGNSLVKAIRTYQTENNPNDAFTVDYTNNINTDKLSIDGNKPDAGKIAIDNLGKVRLSLWDDTLKKCITKGINEKNIKIENKTKNECTF